MRCSAPERLASAASAPARIACSSPSSVSRRAVAAASLGVADGERRASALQRDVLVAEVLAMGAAQDARAVADRLDRVLPALLDERAADERDRRECVEKAELADRVRQIDLGPGRRVRAERALRHGKALDLSSSAIAVPRSDGAAR